MLRNLLLAAAAGTGATAATIVAVVQLLGAMQRSVGTAPPSQTQQEEEDAGASPLLRHCPSLRGKIAFRSLGTFPTPVHRGTITVPWSGNVVNFLVKVRSPRTSRGIDRRGVI